MARVTMKGMFAAIEKWGSESDDRAQLLVILVCAALCVLVLAVIAVLAVVMLPREVWPF